jgi:hydroxymethylpyrimidine pyrophosphatase-like HAD family hydrolase
MRYQALAADYDGTLASDSRIADSTAAMLRRVANTGRRLVLVTGRELPDLIHICPQLELFDRVVAENGALLYSPKNKQLRTFAPPPPGEFIDELKRRNVTPLSIGACIVATFYPHQEAVLDVIRELGLQLQVIFNKGAVMVLPTGVDKASGLMAALQELGLSGHNVVALGDGENDHALLSSVGYSVAVGNAVPMLKKFADRTVDAAAGAGCEQIMAELIANDLEGKGAAH